MGLFKKTKLGYAPLKKLKPAIIKNDIASSKLLGYEFTLPKDFEFEDVSKYNTNGSMTEFSAVCKKTATFISVLITPSADKDAKSLAPDWEKIKPNIEKAIFERTYKDFDSNLITHTEFMGYPCAYYAGILNHEFADHIARYKEIYLYLTPYGIISFAIFTKIDDTAIHGLFRNFTNTKKTL